MRKSVIFVVVFLVVACNSKDPSGVSESVSNNMSQTSVETVMKDKPVYIDTDKSSNIDRSYGGLNVGDDTNTSDDFAIRWGQMGDSEKQYFLNQLNKNMGTSFDFKKVNEDPSKLFLAMSGIQDVMGIGELRDMVPKSDTKDTFELLQEHSSGYSVPELQFFATNKSDRFLVDFEDIVAGHPLVGANSPRPHNDAQVYFSNSDSRWINATNPEDYPPIYAVADGFINMPSLSFYNIVDHSNSNPPWWHVAYVFTLRIATHNGNNVEFLYQMEPYMIPELVGKPKDFYRQFIKVENGQFVKKGDILGYMYVPTLEEMVGNKEASSHIAFSLMKQPSTVFSPAIFSENVVQQFGNIYRNPAEGWESKSFGNDWNRGRGLPDGMGWMISGAENPFSDNDAGVLIHDGIKDLTLDHRAMVKPRELGFDSDRILYSEFGWGDTVLEDVEITGDWQLLFAGIGGPMTITFTMDDNGTSRDSQVFELRDGQNFRLDHKDKFTGNIDKFDISINDPKSWGWSLAFADADASYTVPGTTRDIKNVCPPGCPPSPNPYKLKK